MKATTKDRLAAAIALAFVASLLVQREYQTPFGGVFPDSLMVLTVLLSVALLALSFRSRAVAADSGKKPAIEAGNWQGMAVVGAILLAWALLLVPLGFAVTGVVGFAAIALYLAEDRTDVKVILRSVVVAAVVTGVLIAVFQYLLQVPLPQGTLFT